MILEHHMSEFWIPTSKISRGLAGSRRRQTLGTFASFRRVDRTQPFSGRVRKHFFVAERRHRRRHRRRRLSHPCARASTTPDVESRAVNALENHRIVIVVIVLVAGRALRFERRTKM